LTFASGGLAGAVYTHYANRPEPTSVAVSTSAVTIADPQSAGSLIPDLKVQVGSAVIGSLYAQTVTFDVIGGPYADSAEAAISFANAPHIYGTPVTSVPSPLHSIVCTPIANGFRCRISPLKVNSGGPFRLSIATDKPELPKVDIVAKDVQLVTASQLAAQKSSDWSFPVLAAILGSSFLISQLGSFIGTWKNRSSNLVILDAQYGCEGHRFDVTKQLNDAIENGTLHIFVGNELAGDPCPSVPKDLILKYKYKGKRLEMTLKETATLDLP